MVLGVGFLQTNNSGPGDDPPHGGHPWHGMEMIYPVGVTRLSVRLHLRDAKAACA